MIIRIGVQNSIMELIILELIKKNPMSKVRWIVTLHLVRAIYRKSFHGIINRVDRREKNENLCAYSDDSWENAYCSNQCHLNEVCSRIDSTHANYFILSTASLVNSIKVSHEHTACFKILCSLL